MSGKKFDIEFAIYFVPSKDTDLYRIGTEIVGYDIREEKIVKLKNDYIFDRWRQYAKPYGFHLTLTDVVRIGRDRLEEILKLAETIITGTNSFFIGLSDITRMPNNPNVLVIACDLNEELLAVHDRLVRNVQKHADDSDYLKNIAHGNFTKSQKKNIRHFLSPYILSDFSPHFTLLNPYPYSKRRRESVFDLTQSLTDNLPIGMSVRVKTISIVARSEGENFFRIVKEYQLNN